MKQFIKYTLFSFSVATLWIIMWQSNATINHIVFDSPLTPDDTAKIKTSLSDTNTNLKYPFKDFDGYPYSTFGKSSPLFLKQPKNYSTDIEYDTENNEYKFREKINTFDIRTPNTMTFEEYRNWDFNNSIRQYWRQRYKSENFQHQSRLIPAIKFGGEVFDRLFGNTTIDIKPQGSAELIFGLKIDKSDNPSLQERLRKTTTFDFQEKIQMSVTGQIGDKMKLTTNYNTEATFEFENKMNLAYEGKEDEIIRKIEAGNVTLPLSGSLITGSQSLFGIKTELQFGKLNVATIFSQEKGKKSVINVEGGAQTQEFEVYVDDYEANKHFFLTHFFQQNYDYALQNLPVINSGYRIEKIEVWVTNKTGNFTDARNIIAFMDLAETKANIYNSQIAATAPNTGYPSNDLNSLYNMLTNTFDSTKLRDVNQVNGYLASKGFIGGVDFEKIESARKLSASEYTINDKLGYISLNSSLNADEILAVAFEYTYRGKVYRVGEFSNSGVGAPKALILKLIKGTALTPRLPTWKLMMKNIYAIGAYRVNSEDFKLQVYYQNDKTGAALNYIDAGDISKKVLISVLNLDNLNTQGDPYPDGVFDFIDGVTINASNGRIIFPVVEPFGSFLRKKIGNNTEADKYVFQELYDSTQSNARQIAEKNKFFIKGTYKSSSSSDISLNAMNIPEGSVSVTAGGRKLEENIDYTVDYTLGRVKIINKGLLESGTPLSISLESNSLFNIQSKTLMGTHLNYKISDEFNVGATILNLSERPLTQKVNIGDEPISNTIWGIDGTYRTDAPFLTKMVDRLPFIETKEKSTLTLSGEFAHLIPGHSKIVEKSGVSYIDDFEGTKTSIDIKSIGAWVLASTPQGQNDMFPEGNLSNNLAYGFNRAKLAWYVIDPLFLRDEANTPKHLSKDDQSNHLVREIFESELFPFKENYQGVPTNIPVLNLAFYPQQKGPYNYDVAPSPYSSGIDALGFLQNPASRWGGIMRKIETNDFEAANIEAIEFWVMNPFVENQANSSGGELYFNLGNISEDILRDSRKSFEDGLPATANVELVDTTAWGRVPLVQSLVRAFNNDKESRKYQDVGLDGLSDEDERLFFASSYGKFYLDSIKMLYGASSVAYQKALNDPSNDNFHYFRGSDYDVKALGILQRYKNYNNPQGNSPTSELSPEAYPTQATTLPDAEDINRDNTLSENESYYQYKIDLKPDKMRVGQNFITDSMTATITLRNGKSAQITWYQFKIPVREYQKVVGTIEDFKSIRFLRMFMRGFTDSTVLRFATLDLVRDEWRKYNFDLTEGGLIPANPVPEEPNFDISAVNIEENGSRSPINYILPPGISRVTDPSNPQLRQLNEQSIVLRVCELADGDAKAAYKRVDLDVRQYKRIKMDVHAEALPGRSLNDGDVYAFIRLGSDYKNNYYEYEIPLQVTPYGSYDNESDDDRAIVWPTENRFDFAFDLLQTAKQRRNDAMREAGSQITISSVFEMMDGNNRISIKGNPNLSNIRTIMIGIRNRKKSNNPDKDDGLPKCVEVWMNELRLTDFKEKGGWAAIGRANAKLADFGNVTVSGNISKPGFGSIEKKVNERNKEEIIGFDVASNLELGRFFSTQAGIKVPLYLGYSEYISNPQYNPLDPDIPLRVALNDAPNKDARDSLKHISQDYTQRKSINFTNVKIDKGKANPAFYDISNWSLTYAYSELNSRNINTEYNQRKNYRGAINYNFTTTPKNIAPFSNSKKLFKAPAFKLIKDFNFYYLPMQVSFVNELDRQYEETQLRNIESPNAYIPLLVNKNFLWNRYYDVRYNLTKSLKFNFTANNMARIDEPEGRINKNDDDYKQKMDSIWNNLLHFRRNTQYHHDFKLDYTIPINKIPILNWITATANYGGTYDWIGGPIMPDTSRINLGNTIKNSNTSQLNGQVNLLNLYTKVPYLKRINTKYSGKGVSNKPDKKTEKVTYTKDNIKLTKDVAKSVFHNLGTDNITIKFTDTAGVEIKGKEQIISDNKILFTPSRDCEKAKVVISGEKEVSQSLLSLIMDNTAFVLMGVRNIRITYQQTNGTLLPGYMPNTKILGMEDYYPDPKMYGVGDFEKVKAPGFPFIMGMQNRDFAQWAADHNLITLDSSLAEAYSMTHTETFNLRSSIEPISSLRIELTADRTFGKNINEYYIADAYGNFEPKNTKIAGNFTMSFNTWSTAFEGKNKRNRYRSKAFQEFSSNRIIIAQRLADKRGKADNAAKYNYNPNNLYSDGYPDGYGPTSQDVLIPAFLAAYSGKDPKHISLASFPSITRIQPNWTITYDGLTKIKYLKKYINTASMRHSYRSSFNVASYTTNLFYNLEEADNYGFSFVRDEIYNKYFIPQNEIASISITELISPLINIDVTWKNKMITKFEVKKTRNLTFSLSNSQLTEVNGTEWLIGGGYRIPDVIINIKSGGGQKTFKSDLNLKADFSLRNNYTIIRKLVENVDQITLGSKIITIKLSGDYVLSDKFNLRLFYDQILNRPHTSNSFPSSNINVGFSIRFTLTS